MEGGEGKAIQTLFSSEDAPDYALRLAPFSSQLCGECHASPLFPQEKAEQFKVTASRYSAYLAWEYIANSKTERFLEPRC